MCLNILLCSTRWHQLSQVLPRRFNWFFLQINPRSEICRPTLSHFPNNILLCSTRWHQLSQVLPRRFNWFYLQSNPRSEICRPT